MEEMKMNNMEELTKKVDELTRMVIASRDIPPDETWSKLLYEMQGDLKVHTQILTDIKEQTLKTNGRVNKLEEWKSTMTGKMIATSSIFAFITPFIYWYLTK
jgi:hypothetical protein